MISQEVWKQIDEYGHKRAQLINNFVKVGYTVMYDLHVSSAHTAWAQAILDNYPEIEAEYSLETVKEMIAQCSEEYIIDKSLFS